MWLRPHKAGIHQPHLVQTLHLLEAELEQVFGLQGCGDPGGGGVQVPLAAPAEVQCVLLGDALGDVIPGAYTGDAAVGGVGLDLGTAITTQTETNVEIKEIAHIHSQVRLRM